MPNRRDTLVAYLHPNEVASSFHQSLCELLLADITAEAGVIADATYSRVATGGVPDGRNLSVQHLLKGDLEWLFFIDADMGFLPDTLFQLRRVADPVERPVVGGLCFAYKERDQDGYNGFVTEAKPTIYDWTRCDDGFHRYIGRDVYPVGHVITADATGAACLLIHRSVFERMVDEFGAIWFDRTLATDGQLMGEDIAFFDRCRRLGIPLHLNTAVRTTHCKTTWVSEGDFWRTILAAPATESVDVIIPVLHRPQNVAPLMESLRASTGLAQAWFVIEPGDDEERSEVIGCGGRVLEHPGSFAEKVNHAYGMIGPGGGRHDPAPWIFLAGDDVRFRPGWLDQAQAVAHHFDASVVGTNDLGNPAVLRGEHATHMLISRTYIDELGASGDGPGIVCHDGYRHWFVDNEIVVTAMRRGVWQMALGSIVEHLHPLWGKGEPDEIYELGQSYRERDEALFRSRVATLGVAA